MLDLPALDTSSGHKVLVTGYDFLTDVGKAIRTTWKAKLGAATPDASLAPMGGSLMGGGWGLGSVPSRVTELRTHLGGK